MSVDKRSLYENYISKLEEALETENKDGINYILEYMYTIQLSEHEREEIDDILQEATLYMEFNDESYKEEALQQIEEFKNEF